MATKAEELDVDGVAVRFTNPDKVYFPRLGSGGTKGKVVEYYRTVAAGGLLTALRDRPTHLQRFPDGIEGEEIYQKRVPEKHPDYLHTCRVTFPSGRTADALMVTHPSAIVWAAQMGTVTFHPWQVRCPDTDHPDELRVDLDPQPGTGFAEARTVAVDILKPLLDELGLVGYPKTSGGRGVHVFLRIRHRLGLHRRAPGRHRVGARNRKARAGIGDDVVVEGGTRAAAVHRLQPERAGPNLRLGVLGAAPPRSPRCRRR